jgi:hypothetical protein
LNPLEWNFVPFVIAWKYLRSIALISFKSNLIFWGIPVSNFFSRA